MGVRWHVWLSNLDPVFIVYQTDNKAQTSYLLLWYPAVGITYLEWVAARVGAQNAGSFPVT